MYNKSIVVLLLIKRYNMLKMKSRKASYKAFAVLVALAVPVFFAAASALSSQKTRLEKQDKSGHSLISKWKEYNDVKTKDLPQKEAGILLDIMEESDRKNLYWDFYDAALEYYSAKTGRNWKDREEVMSRINGMAASGYPVVAHNLRSAYILTDAYPSMSGIMADKTLKNTKSEQFYANDSFLNRKEFPASLRKSIRNDYEYLLWSRLLMPEYFGMRAETMSAAAEYFAGAYPKAAYIEFLQSESSSELRDFVRKYEKKAVRLFADAELTERKLDSLDNHSGTSDDYRALRSECEAFAKLAKTFKGAEADLIDGFDSFEKMIGRLDASRIRVSAKPEGLMLQLRNVAEVGITVSPYAEDVEGEPVFEKNVENASGSYAVTDTLIIELPKMNDGEYVVRCKSGDLDLKTRMHRNSISVACTQWKDGISFYPADFKTGKPVERADMEIFRKGEKIYGQKDVLFNGPVRLDSEFYRGLNMEGRYSFVCSYTDAEGYLHRSDAFYFGRDVYQGMPEAAARESLWCSVFKDRAAYNPGDTLHYKAIIYKDKKSAETGYEVMRKGYPVSCELLDSQGAVLSVVNLETNVFGSVAGSFVLPEDGRNGNYSLRIKDATGYIGSGSFTVDEFRLPTFDLQFDPVGQVYFAGDEITVSGTVKGYSGHSLSNARLQYSISDWQGGNTAGTLQLADDGRFSLKFTAGEKSDKPTYRYYNVSVKVIDLTGETLEFYTGVAVNDFYMDVTVENESDGSSAEWDVAPSGGADRYRMFVLDGDFAVVNFSVKNANINDVAATVKYKVTKDGETVCESDARSNEKQWIDLSAWGSGTFRLTAEVEIRGVKHNCVCDLIKTSDTDTSLDVKLKSFFKVLKGNRIAAQFGTTSGPVWAVVQLFGGDGSVLKTDLLHLTGKLNESGSLVRLDYEYESQYPDVVKLSVFYFKDGDRHIFSHDFERPYIRTELPLTFSRFTDKSVPRGECTYQLKTLPGVECLVSVFDKATETVRPNRWWRIAERNIYSYFPSVWFHCGDIAGSGSAGNRNDGDSDAIPFLPTGVAPRYTGNIMAKSGEKADLAENVTISYDTVAEEVAADGGNFVLRENFANLLAFYPYLVSDENGIVEFSFDAADKLSTYYVSVFAHNKSMENNVLRKEMLVSLPVRLSVEQPVSLYENDKYMLKVSLSNMADKDSDGTVTVRIYDGAQYEGKTPVAVMSHPVSVQAGNAVSDIFEVDVPENVGTLGLKVIYNSKSGGSDGMFFTIPVFPAKQILTEAHSAVYRPGMDKDSLYNALVNEFVNGSGLGVEAREIDIWQMLMDGLPQETEISGNDVVSVSAALVSSRLRDMLENKAAGCAKCDELMKKVLEYQNADGGFAWLEGAESSPIITSVILERFAMLLGRGLLDTAMLGSEEILKAVSFLDDYMFSSEKYAVWGGDISMERYLYIRSSFDYIPLSVNAGKKEMKAFRKNVKEYLFPKPTAETTGNILYKIMRVKTLLNFIAAPAEKNRFSESFGIPSVRKLSALLDSYMASVKEYAVEHRSGGLYYPNAVMPFRGLMQSELYAHLLIADILSVYGDYADDASALRMADGIRLWIMIQKETQHWQDDPAYLLAMASVADGSDDLMATRIMVLSQKYLKPFDQIKEAGNEMSLKVTYYKEVTAGKYEVLEAGDTVNTGDKVKAVYELWSAENRSFVKLSAPRHQSLRPVNQLSGPSMLRFGPMRCGGFRIFAPYSYREVKGLKTNWYFDAFPEEKTVIEEVYFVTQSGEFTCPVAEVECLYSPHYRANSGFSFILKSE